VNQTADFQRNYIKAHYERFPLYKYYHSFSII